MIEKPKLMFTLPLSQRVVSLRVPVGADEIEVLESHMPETAVGVALLSRLTSFEGGGCAVGSLPVTDFEYLLLQLRKLMSGDRVRTNIACPEGCGSRIDVEFSIKQYIEHTTPRPARGLCTDREAGWYRLAGIDSRFRVPTAADQIAAYLAETPELELLRRCTDPAVTRGAHARRIEAAMEAMAPSYCQDLEGVCPSCGKRAAMFFDVQQFVLGEVRNRASFLYEDVHAIASRYGWSEESILDMPTQRRARYADRSAQAGVL